MKVHMPEQAYVLEPQDVELVYRGLLAIADNLDSFRQWIDKREETADAIDNITKEAAIYRQLALKIYGSGLGTAMLKPAVERVQT